MDNEESLKYWILKAPDAVDVVMQYGFLKEDVIRMRDELIEDGFLQVDDKPGKNSSESKEEYPTPPSMLIICSPEGKKERKRLADKRRRQGLRT